MAAAEAAELREDEPDPMALLAALPKLDQCPGIGVLLGIDKSLQVKRVDCGLQCRVRA